MMTTCGFHIKSNYLGEHRAVTVFLPRNHDPLSDCPVVFCADGQTAEAFSERIKLEIDKCELPDVVLVGVHSSDRRFQEYTLGQDEVRFRQHEQFFTEELPASLNTKFGLMLRRNRTAVFGVSHGGAFALTMASRHRDMFGVVIAFSTAGTFEEYLWTRGTSEPQPRFYLSAGSREKPLLRTTRRFAGSLRRCKADFIVTERNAGHDYEYWDSEFPLALKWAFGTDNDRGHRDATNDDQASPQ